jgi:soluble lytic murein transglycosylase
MCLSAAVVALSARVLLATGAPAPHVWSQYALARAASADGAGIDEAAKLCAAGEYDAALELLRDSDDSLRTGILACNAGRYGAAIGLLGCGSGNEYLEAFRLYYRAKSLFGERRIADAAAALERLSALGASGLFSRMRSLPRSARDLYGEIIASNDSLFASTGIPEDTVSLSGRVLLLLADRLWEVGRDSLATAVFVRGSTRIHDRSDASLFSELFEKIKPRLSAMRRNDLLEVAGSALRWELYDAVEAIGASLLERRSGDSEAALLKAMVVAGRGNKRTAIALLDDLRTSGAPRSVRQRAMLRAASLEYELKRYAKAAERYHELGMTFSGTHESIMWLDRAARLEVSLGRYERASAWWNDARIVAGKQSNAGARAKSAVSQAVMTVWLGHRKKAYEILTGAVAPGRAYRDPQLLYWLSCTAPSDSERTSWEATLAAEFPHSLYAYALRHSIDSLLCEATEEECRARLEAMLRSEPDVLDSLHARPASHDSLVAKPAFEAWLYMLDRGFVEEARDCSASLRREATRDWDSFLIFYRLARVRGYVDLSISLAWDWWAAGKSETDRLRFLYPVAYADLVARESAAAGIPPELVLAVMREESRFNCYATSRSGAEGLMQLLPATARWIARRSGPQQGFAERLSDPAFNVAIGCRYLDYLLERFDGSLVGALAAYNGGENKMAGWKKSFDPNQSPLIALEMIGPAETRGYVVKVLESMLLYRSFTSTGV